ncbi:MAG: hypothetical protein E7261_03895 [Lachnospiraceae bacterium]|nr:hypothetical protein [Lachnospiraceae bacterium]
MEIYLIGCAIILAFLIIQFYTANTKRKKNFHERIIHEWGKVPEREYTEAEFESITHYYRNTIKNSAVEDNCVDDITWNDLDMDEIFMQMNNTYSSAGEEYLYYMLRTPQVSEDELLKREELITFFANNKDAREKLQMVYGEIGRKRGISVSDYISRLKDVQRENNWKHYSIILMLFAVVGIFFIDTTIGVLGFVAFTFYSIMSYYKRKSIIEHYFVCFRIINNMISNIKKIRKCDIFILEPYIKEMEVAAHNLRGIEKGVGILPTDNLTGSILDLVLDYIRMMTHIDLIRFNNMLCIFLEKEEEVNVIIKNVGLIEAMIAVASFRENLDYYCIPELADGKPGYIDVSEIYHPVLVNPVSNSITTKKSVLITGSNASGKSTFLKSVAINAILAQTIHTAASKEYRASFFKIMSSMALKDNLLGNESYYIVEIKSLKRIIDNISGDVPVLCFVDEVLRGTNTIERIAASSQILKFLSGRNAICFAATHDIELTHILEGMYANYHFQEEVLEDDIMFNYKLYEGRAVSRNAIKLLKVMGYEDAIIDEANQNAAYFIEEGKWKTIV